MTDPRAAAAKFYDLDEDPLDDVPFYISHLPNAKAEVLELGCGTGRVSVPLSKHCARLCGIDHSEAMLEIAREKLRAASVSNVELSCGDITRFDLGRQFDLVIAPYRVLQNLETDAEVDGLLSCIRRHLRAGGRAILNTFNVSGSREDLVAQWSKRDEILDWERATADGRVACFLRRTGIQLHPLVLRPELVYRRYRGGALLEESVQRFAMRCYSPAELVSRIEQAGFAVTATYGGYAGERYGEGPELVVEFGVYQS